MAIQEIPDEEREDDDSLLWMIKQLSDEKLKFVWPCIISILVQAGMLEYKPSQEIIDISVTLQGATPMTFNTLLSYEEKIKILIFLCNSCHDLTAFREYISNRLKEKHKHTKEKQDTYIEIRKIEQEKLTFKKASIDNDFVKDEGVNIKIFALEEELKNASRTQGKVIRDKLSDLTKEKDIFKRNIEEYDGRVIALNEKIQRLNNIIWKVSLKISIIGRDLNNEY
jgi:predicted metal-binding protein